VLIVRADAPWRRAAGAGVNRSSVLGHFDEPAMRSRPRRSRWPWPGYTP